eukprot:429658-Alexandrium_andersonii.AAC.1
MSARSNASSALHGPCTCHPCYLRRSTWHLVVSSRCPLAARPVKTAALVFPPMGLARMARS